MIDLYNFVGLSKLWRYFMNISKLYSLLPGIILVIALSLCVVFYMLDQYKIAAYFGIVGSIMWLIWFFKSIEPKYIASNKIVIIALSVSGILILFSIINLISNHWDYSLVLSIIANIIIMITFNSSMKKIDMWV